MNVETTDLGWPETGWSSLFMNSMTLPISLQCHQTLRRWSFCLKGRCSMMTFKQWLKHREQNPQPTQPEPSQPSQLTGIWHQTNPETYQRSNRAIGIPKGSIWFGWSDERFISSRVMVVRWNLVTVNVFNRSHNLLLRQVTINDSLVQDNGQAVLFWR